MNISNMTLEQKIGQLIIAGFTNNNISKQVEELINKYHIGNIIHFARNFKNTKQFYNMNKGLQRLATKENKIPLFISIDQEGGMVTRINNGATFFPGNMALSAGGNKEDAYKIGLYSGEELKSLGINMNIAPVLDVNVNSNNPVIGVRSYGENPKRVAELGMAYINGLQKNEVIAVAKHFPGHGDTNFDSHLSLNSVNHSMKRLEKVELYPFRKTIENGVKAIMSAHIILEKYDKKLPSTLSYKVITNLLRKKLGFKGMVISDSLEMGAIADNFGVGNGAIMAINAGIDLICVPHTYEKQIEARDAILKAVKDGKLSEKRIDESVNRIINYKKYINIKEFLNSTYDYTKDILENKNHKEIVQNISDKSMTIVKGKKYLPISKEEKTLFISTNAVSLNGADSSVEERSINSFILEKYPDFETEIIEINPSFKNIKKLVSKSINKKRIIICTYNANLNIGQVKLVEEIYKINKKIIVIAMRNPYDFNCFKYVPCCILAYEYTPLSVLSIIKLLRGSIQARGVCPVKLEV